jgi:hypothetical protein
MFLLVVLFLPRGLVGLAEHGVTLVKRLSGKTAVPVEPAAEPAAPAAAATAAANHAPAK